MSTLQFQFLILIIAGWINRTQQDDIEYLVGAVESEPVSGREIPDLPGKYREFTPVSGFC